MLTYDQFTARIAVRGGTLPSTSASALHAFIKSSELPCDFRAGEMSSPLLRSSSRRVVAYAARFSASAARRSASRLAVSAVAVLAAA